MKELAIGKTGLVDGVLVKCVEWDTLEGGCNGCAFYNDAHECVTDCPCGEGRRKDKKNVKFIPAEFSEYLQIGFRNGTAEELSIPPTSV